MERLTVAGAASRRTPLAVAALATLFAAWLYGWRVIDPTSTAWLLHGDPAQHYLGSVFFLGEPWHWPPGLITRFGEQPTSVVFTDAIPLVVLLAKLLQVPPGTQYFGLWMVLCHALSAWWGVQLLRRMGLTHPLALAGGGLVLATAPALLFRAYGHEALMGHFLVIAALERMLAPWRSWPWLALAAVAVLVHPYLALMVCVLAAASGLAAWKEGAIGSARLFVLGGGWGLLLAGEAWLAGYFAGSGEISAAGHRWFTANLLTWFDPMSWKAFMAWKASLAGDTVVLEPVREWSRWLPGLKQAQVGQYEGFAYFGAGALLAAAVAVGAAASGRAAPPTATRTRWTAAIVAALFFALWSLSARPTLGGVVLADIPLGSLGERIVGVFRASGRFIWPATYLAMAWALATAGRLRWGVGLLVLVLVVQQADLFYKYKEFRIRFRSGPADIEQPTADPVWQQALVRCPRLEMVSGPQPKGKWVAAALAAGRAEASFYPAPTARYSPEAAAARQETVKKLIGENGWRRDVVYMLVSPLPDGVPVEKVATALPAGMRHVRADGYDLAVPDACLGR
ncbi:DUF6311 domain-containing protein [Ramlibacter sp. WS9]|uniref:DUF6311 domain-containing protein n=1 Tax=Ramlibacter sp. WS9 TaxID=1882741 RepID=UPI001143067C|nr:DUF6311 domain-containing protein [Ramlibacter sp. WS9]ROZ77453.1 hypothetical protein EEB15_08340 [Ramlibacter sp. WS9]